MSNLTLGSLFDGSGGFPLAGLLSGITPVWASEIEPFPIRVTTKRLPFMKHYGDISAMNGGEIEPVDIITFGSPCQDMSVAGKRDGLDGSRSSLFYEAIRIVKEMRCKTNGQYPRYIVWENVPGAFSSNKGEDFKCVLESICQVKGETTPIPKPDKWQPAGSIMGEDYSIAWRVLDAQFWGVPQRRKRIFLVADFASQCADKILFESEGLSGYSAESFRAWQETAGRIEDCFGATGCSLVLNDQGGNRMDVTDDVTSTLRAEAHHPPVIMESAVAVENHPTDSRVKISDDGNVQTLTSRMGTGGNNVPLVMKIRAGCEGGGKGPLIQKDKSATLSCNNDQTLFEPKVYGICSKDSNSMKSSNPDSGIYEADTSRTIDGNGGNPSCNQGGMAVVSVQGSMIGRKDKNGPRGSGVNEDVSFTLDSVDRHAVAYGIDRAAFNQGKNAKYNFAVEEELEPTIVAKGPGAVAEPTFSSSKASFFTNASEEKTGALVATDYKDPPIVNDSPKPQGFYPQMKAECVTLTEDKATTLVNGTNPGYQNGVVDTEYIVRRLTPTECARLQGFPDWWCSGLETENPTTDDIRLWYNIFETHRKIIGTSSKPKSIKQIQKWLESPHSDSAEYKMWGNGVALPCVIFVLSGIEHYHNNTVD
jgi:DNA (cytosine-5)-methyltransferase 1